jgi:hypothetical protein
MHLGVGASKSVLVNYSSASFFNKYITIYSFTYRCNNHSPSLKMIISSQSRYYHQAREKQFLVPKKGIFYSFFYLDSASVLGVREICHPQLPSEKPRKSILNTKFTTACQLKQVLKHSSFQKEKEKLKRKPITMKTPFKKGNSEERKEKAKSLKRHVAHPLRRIIVSGSTHIAIGGSRVGGTSIHGRRHLLVAVLHGIVLEARLLKRILRQLLRKREIPFIKLGTPTSN